MLYQLGKLFYMALFKLFGRLRVIGAEHIPASGGVLLAPNHTSYADPPLAGVASPRPVWFMAKSELFRIPVLGWLIARVHAFPVKRAAVDREALRRAHELLTAGEVVTVFIEGRTSPDGLLQPPTLGPAMIALRAGVPIVPAAIINADHMLPRDGKLLKLSRVTVVFGAPLTFPHLAGRHADRTALREVSETVMRHIAKLMWEHGAADRVPSGYLEQEVTQDV